MLSEGEIVLPIDSVFPIERVGEAYERLEAGHVCGKVVVVTE
jgi:D-arabinose 1-dehydrogenase-like Zn-dependent alcohol dehydrogenase